MLRRNDGVRALTALATATGLAAVLTAFLEPYRLRSTTVRLALPRAERTIAGLRIAFLTDFHVGGPGPTVRNTIAAIRQVRAWQPHLVLLGGDYFDQGRLVETDAFDGLGTLPNVFAVLGNHDHRQGEENARAIAAFLVERGVRVLRNERILVSVAEGHEVELVAFDDPYTGLHDPSLLAYPLASRPRFLLAHSPSLLEIVPPGYADLGLFGHTHWGQVRLNWSRFLNPLDAAWYLDRIRGKPHARWQRGWFWERGMLVYVSTGLGQTQLPVRLGAPPEVVLLELDPQAVDPRWACDHPWHYVRKRAATFAPEAKA